MTTRNYILIWEAICYGTEEDKQVKRVLKSDWIGTGPVGTRI